MAKRPDRIAERIAAIAAAEPVKVRPSSLREEPRRKEPRRPVYRQGRLTIAGGARLGCVIADVSPNGARVELDGAESLPDYVVLRIVMTGEIKRARVVWRRGRSAGLSFLVGHRVGFGSSKVEINP